MKGKLITGLFALPFAAVGVWMLWSIASDMMDAWEMRGWFPVPATLTNAGYETRSGDDSDTYEAYAEYRYSFNGQSYMGNRVTVASGGDNIGSYQQDTGRRLQRAWQQGEPVTVYVDPDTPSESIIDRNPRWGLIGFKSIFLFVFGGVGFGLLYFIVKAPEEKDATSPEFASTPWRLNDKWQTETIRSNSKLAMWGAWGFAAFWNLISAPLPFILYGEITEKENYAALIGLLFPLVGLALLWWAIKRTLEWRRFGPAPVVLDPFPGSIGGHVGGTVDLNLPFDSNNRFELTLTNLYSHYSGSGKNRSRKESARWQDKLVAHAEPGGRGTRLTFRFDVPEDLGESDAQQDGDSYFIWRLNLKASIEGIDVDRDYEIPVYATATHSRRISERTVRNSRSEQAKVDDAEVLNAVVIRQGVYGKQLVYPMGRYFGASFIGILVGSIFAGAGWYLAAKEGQTIFGSVFVLMGSLVGLAALYAVFNSLEVLFDGTSIRSVRRILGIPIRQSEMRRDAFERFDKDSSFQTQSGGKHVVYYSVYAIARTGERMVIGEGFKGANEAKAAMRLFERELGLRPRDGARERGDNTPADLDILAADS